MIRVFTGPIPPIPQRRHCRGGVRQWRRHCFLELQRGSSSRRNAAGHDFPNNKQYLLYTFNPAITGQVVQVAHTTPLAQYLVLSEVEVLTTYTNTPSIQISQGRRTALWL